MGKSDNNGFHEFTPYFISLAIHALFFFFILLISFITSYFFNEFSMTRPAPEIIIESIDVSQESSNMMTGSDREAVLKGLNDSAGRELWECARSGISVTPDNFLEYVKIREFRKGLRSRNGKTKDDIYEKYPFLTGSNQFESGIGHKLKSDFHECYQDACRMINFNKKDRAAGDNVPEEFISAVLEYLNGQRSVRTWRTLWMSPQPAAWQDKIELVRLVRRLHDYCNEGNNAGYEHMSGSIKILQDLIPDTLKFPGIYKK